MESSYLCSLGYKVCLSLLLFFFSFYVKFLLYCLIIIASPTLILVFQPLPHFFFIHWILFEGFQHTTSGLWVCFVNFIFPRVIIASVNEMPISPLYLLPYEVFFLAKLKLPRRLVLYFWISCSICFVLSLSLSLSLTHTHTHTHTHMFTSLVWIPRMTNQLVKVPFVINSLEPWSRDDSDLTFWLKLNHGPKAFHGSE